MQEFFRKQAVRAWTLTFLLTAGSFLLITSLFSGEEAVHHTLLTQTFWDNLGLQAGTFKAAEWLVLVTPVVALLTAWFAHYGDAKYHGRGIKHIVTQMEKDNSYNLETDVIAASMTKQSVLAAIASILVAVIQQSPSRSTFAELIKFLSTCGFAFTILFLLVSMVCYDYASRFRWKQFHKAQLVRKALLLDVWSWYFLVTSFVLSIALVSPRLSVLTCISAGVLMWWYYFFPGRRVRTSTQNSGRFC